MAAAKLLSPNAHPRFLPSAFSLPLKLTSKKSIRPPRPGPRKPVSASIQEALLISSSSSTPILTSFLEHSLSSFSSPPPFSLAAETVSVGYSPASYYTSLGLFVVSVPGLWSLIKRSVKSKKTLLEGEKKTPNQMAGEILSFFTCNNFVVADRGETITFEGMMVPGRGQAALLTFCTCISLASVAIVLSIIFPDFGNNWFWITVLSPLAGAYYWKKASRKEQIKIKMIVGDDGTLSNNWGKSFSSVKRGRYMSRACLKGDQHRTLWNYHSASVTIPLCRAGDY